MTERCEHSKKRHQGYSLMSASAYVTTAGIAVAEVLEMRPGTRMAVTIVELALFAALLPLTFRAMDARNRTVFVFMAALLTVVDVGVMFTGPAVHYGAILFFIVCTVVAMRMPLAVVLAWDGAAVASLLACLLFQGQKDWLSTTLTFAAGFAAFGAFAFAIRQAQRARAESEHLLEELTSAQGRLRELAVMEERQRLAREMHDAVGHHLTASAVLLDGAARLIAAEPERATRMVATSREQVREGLAELRAAVTALHEGSASAQGLGEVLRALVDVYSQATDAKVTLDLPPDLPEPDPQRKMVLVRTAQEALTNVQKHAQATRVAMELRLRAGSYVLACTDNGRGCSSAATGSGFGLGNLRARAAVFGGSVTLQPGEAGGTVLRLELPSGAGASDA